jgi:phospholipase/carboxylesterase
MKTEATSLSAIEINPNSAPIASVIWLHGLGADGNDFVPIVPELKLPADLPIRFIFPNAPEIPVTINNGYVMRAWFDIYSMKLDHRIDVERINESATSLSRLIEQEESRGIPSDKIILAGFSQGSVIAMTTALQYPKRLGGVIALSGYLPHSEKVFAQASAANRNTPIFLAHGTHDPIVPFVLGEMTRDVLNQHQYPVSWHAYPMPHSVCNEEINDIGNWLKNSLKK